MVTSSCSLLWLAGRVVGSPLLCFFLPLVLLVVFGSQTFRSVHVVWYTSPLLTLPTYTRILPLTSLTLDTEVLSILLSLEPRSRSLSSLHSPTLYYPSLAFSCQTYTSTNKRSQPQLPGRIESWFPNWNLSSIQGNLPPFHLRPAHDQDLPDLPPYPRSLLTEYSSSRGEPLIPYPSQRIDQTHSPRLERKKRKKRKKQDQSRPLPEITDNHQFRRNHLQAKPSAPSLTVHPSQST